MTVPHVNLDQAPLATPKESIATADLALGLRTLAELSVSGLPLSRALHVLAEIEPQGWERTIEHLRNAVREGKSLSTALRDAPVQLPELVVGMTAAGEAAGDISLAIGRAADITEAMAEMRAAVRAALAYPILLTVAGTGAIAIMTGVVVPRFAAILSDLGQTLPRSTQLVMSVATAARTAFLPALLAIAVLLLLHRAWSSSPNGRLQWHSLLIDAPVIGPMREGFATARTTLTLATLLEAGVSLRQALRLAARASGDSAVCARVMEAARRIEAGRPIAAALRETRAVTRLASQLAFAGEASGRLASMLRHAAKMEQQRCERLTRSAVRMLEPTLILLFAGVVALVAAALLQAVYAVRPGS